MPPAVTDEKSNPSWRRRRQLSTAWTSTETTDACKWVFKVSFRSSSRFSDRDTFLTSLGQTIAVDAYVWLHRGAYGCATELVTGKPTRKYVDFCMQRVRLLRHHGISPYLVFDGGPLPAKLGTEKERERKRSENVQKAHDLARQGRHTEARGALRQMCRYHARDGLPSDKSSYQ